MRGLFVCVFLFKIAVTSVMGQVRQFRQVGEYGFGLGATTYIGELNPNFNYRFLRPAGFAFYRINLKQEYFILRLGVMMGGLSADQSRLNDPFFRAKGYIFNTTFFEFSPLLEYNFFNYRSEKELKYRRFHTPYLFGGLHVTSLLNSSNTAPVKDFKNIYVGLLFGAGIKFMISHNWNLGGQLGVRMPYSDRLDGVLNAEMGNYPKNNDIYFVAGIYLSYTILADMCPKKINPY